MKIHKKLITALIFWIVLSGFISANSSQLVSSIHPAAFIRLIDVEKERVLDSSKVYLKLKPVTVTASVCSRSAGGKHEFFSEGDYWWPDPQNQAGPYIRRDGESNPNNFLDHRRFMVRLSIQSAALAAAYRITGEEKYARHAVRHLRAWFVDQGTMMYPHLKYAQAIHGVCTGRGVGVIDTIHLVEVVKAIEALGGSKSLNREDLAALRKWFKAYLEWITTSDYGIEESKATNNHCTAWLFQAVAFAQFVGDSNLVEQCGKRFIDNVLEKFMADNGSFPAEINRTKPYGYSIFHLDICAGVAQMLSKSKNSLWTFETAGGRGMGKGLSFLYPYLKDKSAWPYTHDVMYWDKWPVRQPCLLFGGLALKQPEYIELWLKLRPTATSEEGIRNWPIRQPLLWLEPDQVLLK